MINTYFKTFNYSVIASEPQTTFIKLNPKLSNDSYGFMLKQGVVAKGEKGVITHNKIWEIISRDVTPQTLRNQSQASALLL